MSLIRHCRASGIIEPQCSEPSIVRRPRTGSWIKFWERRAFRIRYGRSAGR